MVPFPRNQTQGKKGEQLEAEVHPSGNAHWRVPGSSSEAAPSKTPGVGRAPTVGLGLGEPVCSCPGHPWAWRPGPQVQGQQGRPLPRARTGPVRRALGEGTLLPPVSVEWGLQASNLGPPRHSHRPQV